MKRSIFFLLISFPFLACESDPKELFNEAKSKINSNGSVAYKQLALWPNPVGKVDTVSSMVSFRKNERASTGYDLIGEEKGKAFVLIDNNIQQVNHSDSTVLVYPEAKEEFLVKDNVFLTFSPLTYLNYSNWKYSQDTIIHESEYRKYRRVEVDTVRDGKEVYVENNIFINKASALVDQYQRIAYLNGEKTQTIRQFFSDYNLSLEGEPLSYTLPESYITVVYGDKPEPTLAVGEQAPLFSAKDIQGNRINLADLKGEKVLLNFSIINCGYCKVAIDHFNRKDYHLSDKITGIYINPTDEISDVIDYADQMAIPFPVIAGEKSMKERYGVSAYPTFFLIDEQGKIEEIIYGYNKEFFQRIKM